MHICKINNGDYLSRWNEGNMGQRGQKTILFLGTANHHRSRLAELVFNDVAGRMGLPWRAASRGLAVDRHAPKGPLAAAAVKALEALRLRSPDAGRAPQQVSPADLEGAALVIALDGAEHGPLLRERFPEWAERAEAWDVADGPDVAARVERAVMDLVARLMGGRPRPEEPPAEPAPAAKSAPPKPATVKVGRETKGRRGKGVTIVSEVPLDEAGLQALAARLKQACGTGGTVKDGKIEIQGDQRDRLTTELERLGYKVKRTGG